jgi:DNA repair protein RadC
MSNENLESTSDQRHSKSVRKRSVRLIRLVTVEQVPWVVPRFSVHGPDDAATFARLQIGSKDREHFLVLHLNGAHQIVSYEVAFIGSLTACTANIREIFKAAILSNSHAIICVHNHPSGDLTPSDADRSIYNRLCQAAHLLDIRLLDFLIVSADAHWSAREHWP